MSFPVKLLLFKGGIFSIGNAVLIWGSSSEPMLLVPALLWLVQRPRLIHRHLAPLFFTTMRCTNGACRCEFDLVQRYKVKEYNHNQPEHILRVYDRDGREVESVQCPKEDCKATLPVQLWSTYRMTDFRIIGNALTRAPGEKRRIRWTTFYRLLRYGPKAVYGGMYVLGRNRLERSTVRKRLLRRLLKLPEYQQVRVTPELDDRHYFIAGKSGTGKSTAIKQRFEQMLEHGDGGMVIDPAGDLVDDLLEMVPEQLRDKVNLIRPRDRQSSFRLDLFDARDEMEQLNLRRELIQAIRAVAESWGGDIAANITKVIEVVELLGGNLRDVYNILTNTKALNQAYVLITDVELQEFLIGWDRMSLKAKAPTVNKIRELVRHPLIGPMLTARESSFDPQQAIKEGQIILVDLNTSSDSDEVKIILGTILIGKIRAAALRLPKDERRKFYLIIDEASDFMHEGMNVGKILSQCRKHRLTLIMAMQYVDQLKKNASAVFGNCGTLITFELGEEDAAKMARQMPGIISSDIMQQGRGECIAQIGQRSYFVATQEPKTQNENQAKYVIERMRRNNPRSEPESDSDRRAYAGRPSSLTLPKAVRGVR